MYKNQTSKEIDKSIDANVKRPISQICAEELCDIFSKSEIIIEKKNPYTL
jgi:hypothetical protein